MHSTARDGKIVKFSAYFHDHIFVPADKALDAMAALTQSC